MSREQPEQRAPGTSPPPDHPARRRPSVLLYLVILFAAAFLLMLMSYFMQQRANQEVLDDLEQTSNSAVQSLENVLQENADLKERVAELEGALSDAQAQADAQAQGLQRERERRERTAIAMDYFWQLDEAYVLGRYQLCRELIAALEDTAGGDGPLKDHLPMESATDNGRFSPAGRYQEICEAVE